MAINVYFVYLIGSEWKGSSTAGVHLQISEITLLCAGSMGVGLWGINMDNKCRREWKNQRRWL